MSFAQGLLAGTQAARNVMDSYKEARDARIQREFAQGLAAINNQAQGPSQFTQDMMPEAAPDPMGSGTDYVAGLRTPQMPNVPQGVVSPQELIRQRIALAERLGLSNRADTYTNQLTGLMDRQTAEQNRAQDIFRDDLRYEQEQQDEIQKAAVENNWRYYNAAMQQQEADSARGLREQQANVLTSQEKRAVEKQNAENASMFGRSQALQLLATGEVDVEKLYELGQAATVSFYEAIKEQGIDLNELGQLSLNFESQLDRLYSTNYSGNEATQLQAVTKLAQRLDPDASNNTPVKFVKQKDGSYIAEEGGVVLAQGSLDDIVTQFKEQLDSNPMGFGVSLYSINKKQLEANSRKVKTDIETAKLSVDQRKIVMDGIKAIMNRTMPPTVGSREYNEEVYALFQVAGVPIEKVPEQFWPENAKDILDARAKASGGGDGGGGEVQVVDPPPVYKTADERVAAILEQQNTSKAGLNTQSGTPTERLAAINDAKRIEELNKVLPAQERKASAAKYSQELESGAMTIDDLLLLKSEGGLGALEEEAITLAIAGYRNRKSKEIAEASTRTGRYSPPIVK